jgi:hypothetical protein
LSEGIEVDWNEATRSVPSPYTDCRYSDTQSASDAVADCARYIQTKNALYAIYCISDADIAYDHVLVEDNFRQWLIEVAIPVAIQKREMNQQEQEALRKGVK